MTSILSNNILKKKMKSGVQNVTGIFSTQKEYLWWKLHLNRKKGVKLQLIKEIQISRHMNI